VKDGFEEIMYILMYRKEYLESLFIDFNRWLFKERKSDMHNENKYRK